ncbi:AAA family ATPase [Ralstonia solanacearum]|nr:AAA family ATPase [Ralstonia solanacearum]
MSAPGQPPEHPPGFAPLGDLALLRSHSTWRLLIPSDAHTALAAERKIRREFDDPPESAAEPHPEEPTPAVPAEVAPALRRVRRRHVRVFQPEALERAHTNLQAADRDQAKYARPLLERARDNDGYRALPRIRSAHKKLERAQGLFANLREPIQKLRIDLTLASAMRTDDFRIRPILLTGLPGVGKTHLALRLADALDVPMRKWAAGSAQASFQLVGSDSGWRHARPGMVVELLAKSNAATPVLVLDEVDKISRDGTYPVLPVLLDLLESETARKFEDAFFRMEFDASRIIVVLTANDLRAVPAPLLSRVEVFDIPAPEPEQRLLIIHAEVERLRRTTRKRIELDPHAAQALAERTDIDLRQTHRLLADAFATALAAGEFIATPTMPARVGQKSIGFVTNA